MTPFIGFYREKRAILMLTCLDGEQEARLVALACSEPPEGQAHWSLRLLADRLVELEIVPDISYQTVGRILKKT